MDGFGLEMCDFYNFIPLLGGDIKVRKIAQLVNRNF